PPIPRILPVLPALSPIGCKGFRHQAFKPECSLGFHSASLSHPAAQLTVFEKDGNTIGECSFIPSGYYKSRLLIVNQAGEVTSICGDNGTAASHCFEYDVRTSFILGGMHEEGRIGK